MLQFKDYSLDTRTEALRRLRERDNILCWQADFDHNSERCLTECEAVAAEKPIDWLPHPGPKALYTAKPGVDFTTLQLQRIHQYRYYLRVGHKSMLPLAQIEAIAKDIIKEFRFDDLYSKDVLHAQRVWGIVTESQLQALASAEALQEEAA